ncbi:MAG: LacI family transcriptional regulator [Acholeplasmataceae bacterium]|jgi:DNA-binding LacI/PurR family transcriptional regulator|nr:LacI family transcriptional regulator [Acholeplasmataceae bacterium]MCK9289274.1 LacI family transcriptional regulator [Acholeplasmataceae bacterium]MCK9427178.1 LacI family transcriptional regulator [Acholeplasmataceae bacterium]
MNSKGAKTMKPTIRDVAKKANVSVSTVSRVINNKGYVHESTRKVVEKVIAELGFVPNQLARSLTTGSSRIIGVIIPHVGATFYGELIAGIESQALASGYKVLFCQTNDDPNREIEYLHFFEQYNIDGLIIASNFSNYEKLAELKIPLITVDHILDENIPSITSNNIKGGELAAQLFLKQQRKNLIVFRGPSFLLTTEERTIGFLKVIKKANLYAEIFDFDLLSPDENLIEQILITNNKTDAIFCFSDTLALATLNVLKKLKIDVPKDLSLVGYDDSVLCNWTTPKLTSIHQSVKFMGKQSFLKLNQLIRGVELEILHDVIDVNLVLRASH